MLLLLVSACLLLLHASAAGTDVVSVSGFVNGTDRLDSIRIVLEDLTGVKKSEGLVAIEAYCHIPTSHKQHVCTAMKGVRVPSADNTSRTVP